MRTDDHVALTAKATIEMYCRLHYCALSCIFYDEVNRCCALSGAVRCWGTLPEEED